MRKLEGSLGEAGRGRGERLTLDTNYRTVGSLRGFYNAYFTEVLSGTYESQKHLREAHYPGKAVTLLKVPDVKEAFAAGGEAGAGTAGEKAMHGVGPFSMGHVSGTPSQAGDTPSKDKDA
jgi:hypothetical protein